MFYFKKNLALWERVLRLFGGVVIALAAYYYLSTGGWRIFAFVIAAIFAGTAIIGYCPIWMIMRREAKRQKNTSNQ